MLDVDPRKDDMRFSLPHTTLVQLYNYNVESHLKIRKQVSLDDRTLGRSQAFVAHCSQVRDELSQECAKDTLLAECGNQTNCINEKSRFVLLKTKEPPNWLIYVASEDQPIREDRVGILRKRSSLSCPASWVSNNPTDCL